jgi:hypothetical protein
VQDVRRDRRVARLRVAASLVAIVAVPWALSTFRTPDLTIAGLLAALAVYLWSALSLAGTDRGPGERKLVDGSIQIDDEDLVVTAAGATRCLPLSGLAGGWTERTPGGHAAVFSFSDGKLVAVEQASEAEAAELLAAHGAGAHARAVRMRGYRESANGRKIAGCFLALFALLIIPVLFAALFMVVAAIDRGSPEPLGWLLAVLAGWAPFALMTAWLWSKVRPTWVHIGADGLMLHGAFRDRFFGHGSIAGAAHTTGGIEGAYHFVTITLKDGRSCRVPAGSAAEATAMIERIQSAWQTTSAQERARLLGEISRNGRPVPEWREALSTLMTRAGYRTAGHDLEEVMRIVEDAAAPLEQRIAAALAARPHGGEPVQRRIRVAAEACVEPKLRVTLEKAAAGEVDDEDLEAIGAADTADRKLHAKRG